MPAARVFGDMDAGIQMAIFLNRVGLYVSPTDSAVRRTLDEFFYGSTDLLLHVYYRIVWDNRNRSAYSLYGYSLLFRLT